MTKFVAFKTLSFAFMGHSQKLGRKYIINGDHYNQQSLSVANIGLTNVGWNISSRNVFKIVNWFNFIVKQLSRLYYKSDSHNIAKNGE